ncbi:MAG TPA: hypothetical protein VGL59_20060, partial [Polyangia bacterium]
MGFFVLFGLSTLALLAALAVAVRARLRGRAEALVAVTLLWNGIIITPIYILGLTSRLRPASLAVGSLVTAAATLLLAARGARFRQLLGKSTRLFLGLVLLPIEALQLSWKSKRFVFVGVAFAALLLPYLAVSAYFGQ